MMRPHTPEGDAAPREDTSPRGDAAPEAASTIRFRRIFLLLLVTGVSSIFVAMIRSFMVTLLLAAIFSGIMYPLYLRLVELFGERRSPAAAVTLVVFLLVLVIPLSAFLGIVTAEAIQVTQSVGPWVEEQVRHPERLEELLGRLPFSELLVPYTDQILARTGEIAARTGTFVVERLAAITRGTVIFFFLLFLMLYAMFYFLRDGRKVLELILYYMPLSQEDEQRMLDKFVSVTRATIKGTLVIGVLQGGLAGAAFAVAGVPGAAFWGTVMAVLSILPGVGSAIVWIPAVVYLIVVGQVGAAIALLVWCAAVVGSIDNVLRPRMVGRDTEMPDLMILLGTLGGVMLFGASGIIIGPIVAALFITVWEIYGVAFQEHLPAADLATMAAAASGGSGTLSPGDGEGGPAGPASEESDPEAEEGDPDAGHTDPGG